MSLAGIVAYIPDQRAITGTTMDITDAPSLQAMPMRELPEPGMSAASISTAVLESPVRNATVSQCFLCYADLGLLRCTEQYNLR